MILIYTEDVLRWTFFKAEGLIAVSNRLLLLLEP